MPTQLVSWALLQDRHAGIVRQALIAVEALLEAGIDKKGVRALARHLGLGDVAELPASPCLSSRVETGIAIDPADLALVHAAETLLAARLGARTLRLADGPDEVHKILIAKNVIHRYESGESWNFAS